MSDQFTDNNVPSLQGKTAFITGGNTGLGFEVAKVMVGRGARVLIGCRSEEKSAEAVERIKNEVNDADISSVHLDLGDLGSIGAAAKGILREPRLDILINNAGIMIPPFELTADGFESQFGVNHLGPFALTGLLIEKLKSTPGARVINTSSLAHRNGKINFEGINSENGYDAIERYCMSKLANLLFSYELERRLRKDGAEAISVACHPGMADTELSRHFPNWLMFFSPLVRSFLNTPAQGAWPTLMAATSPHISGGEYCGPGKRWEIAGPATLVKSTSGSHDINVAKELWKVSEQLTGVLYL